MKLKKITALVLGLLGAIALTACDNEPATTDDTPSTHTHSWNDGEITTPATATQDGVKTFTCNGCGQTKTESVAYTPDNTVTEQEWAIAMAMQFDNYTMSQEMVWQGVTQSIVTAVYGDLIYHDGEQELYLQKVGDRYYEYVKENDEWHKYPTTETYYNAYADANLEAGFVYADFTYNEQTQVYECATASVQNITNATLKFEDKKLVSAIFEMSGVQASVEIEYGNTQVALPQVVPVKTIKNDEMLSSAFAAALDIQAERTIYLAMCNSETNEEKLMYEVRVTENLVYMVTPELELVYQKTDDGEIYDYRKNVGESWTKEHRTGASYRPWEYLVNSAVTMQGVGEYAVGTASLSNTVFNATEKCYMYTVGDYDYQAYFMDGALVKLEVFSGGVKWLVFTYDYEVEEIEIPQVQ